MDTDERAHIENLLQLHQAHLRELELKAAKYGDLDVPTHITLQIAEYRRLVAELTARVRAALPCHNLPPRDYERFIGRQPELAELRRLLQPYPKSRAYVVTIDGIGGIGKSALALETAYYFRDQYAALPEAERFAAIVWVSAKRSYLTADGILERHQAFRTLGDLYAAIAQVLDYPAITRARAEEQRAIVEEVLREQRTLLVLDNLETIDDEELLSFLRELPDPTKAIVTTRYRIDVAYPVRLTGMSHEDALALIDQEAARKDVSLAPAEQAELWQRTGGVPLAIVWSIGLMGLGGSVESVLRRLGSGQSDIARFCFAESMAQIRGRDAHWLLLALSLFAADASREALGMVAGLGEDEFGRDIGLEHLLRLSLVNKEADRFSLLPLTRSFVQSEAAAQAEWIEGARVRWQDYLYSLARYGGRSQNWQGHDILERELQNILKAIPELIAKLSYQQIDADDHIIAPPSVPQAKQLFHFISTIARRCRFRGYWSDCENLCFTAISISNELRDPSFDASEAGLRYLDLSMINAYRGELDTSRQQALTAYAIGNSTANNRLICLANLRLGRIALQNNDLELASSLLMTAFDMYSRHYTDQLSLFIGGMGDLAEHQQDLAKAIDWYQQAVDIDRRNYTLPYLSAHLSQLGQALHADGQSAEARVAYEESLKLARECGRIDIIGRAMYGIACLEYTQSQPQSASANARQALDLFRRLGMKREQAETEALLAKMET